MDLNEFKKQLKLADTTLDENDVDRVLCSALKPIPNSKNRKGVYNLVIVMEELAELTQQVSKYIRGKADRYAVMEELADVYLAARYVKNIVGISDEELNAAINVKKDRQDTKNKSDEEFKMSKVSRNGCFWCGYLGKEKAICTADENIRLNSFFLLDEVPEDCPKKRGVVMEYKGFRTTNIEQTIISDEESVFNAKVINSADYIDISAKSIDDMEPEFQNKIDAYLKICEQYGKNPFQSER